MNGPLKEGGSGIGLHFGRDSARYYIQAWNIGAGGYADWNMEASSFQFWPAGALAVTFDSGGLKLAGGKAFYNNGQQVVGARGPSLPADASDLPSAIALVNAVKARLKATGGHGLVAD